MTLESSCKIKLYFSMFQWQPVPSCGEVHFISWNTTMKKLFALLCPQFDSLPSTNVECGKQGCAVLLKIVVEFLWCLTVFSSPYYTLTMSSGFNWMCIIRQFFIMWCYNLQRELSLMMVVVAATKICWNTVWLWKIYKMIINSILL